jgi:U3 small nucleolar RNA-associated protein 13
MDLHCSLTARTIKIWDLKKLRMPGEDEDSSDPVKLPVQRTWKAHDKDINSVAVSPNDALIATGSADRSVKFWDATSGV